VRERRAVAVGTRIIEQAFRNKVGTNAISYSGAISACEKTGEWQQAWSLIGNMTGAKVEPNTVSYSAGISAFEKRSTVAADICITGHAGGRQTGAGYRQLHCWNQRV